LQACAKLGAPPPSMCRADPALANRRRGVPAARPAAAAAVSSLLATVQARNRRNGRCFKRDSIRLSTKNFSVSVFQKSTNRRIKAGLCASTACPFKTQKPTRRFAKCLQQSHARRPSSSTGSADFCSCWMRGSQ